MSGLGTTAQLVPTDFLSPFNAAEYHVKGLISRIAGATLVQVVLTTNSGAVAPPGYVNVLPLVKMQDGAGNTFDHGVVYQLPVFRLQGGTNACILDPVVGDIGLAIFCDRDISSVPPNAAAIRAAGIAGEMMTVNPGSKRMNDMSDGIYLGALLGPAPTQYVAFSSTGIQIVSPFDIKLIAPTVEINATTSVTITTPTLQVNGAISATGNISSTGGNVIAGAIDLKTHVHTGVSTGSSNTGGPTG